MRVVIYWYRVTEIVRVSPPKTKPYTETLHYHRPTERSIEKNLMIVDRRRSSFFSRPFRVGRLAIGDLAGQKRLANF